MSPQQQKDLDAALEESSQAIARHTAKALTEECAAASGLILPTGWDRDALGASTLTSEKLLAIVADFKAKHPPVANVVRVGDPHVYDALVKALSDVYGSVTLSGPTTLSAGLRIELDFNVPPREIQLCLGDRILQIARLNPYLTIVAAVATATFEPVEEPEKP